MKIFLFKKATLFIVDSIIFWTSLFLALFARRPDIFNVNYFINHIHTFIFVYIIFIIGIYISGLYELPQFILKIKKVKIISYSSLASFIVGSLYFYLFPSDFTPKVVLLMQCVIAFLLVSLWRILSDGLFETKYKTKAMLLDDGVDAMELYNHIRTNNYNIEFVDVSLLKDTESKNTQILKQKIADNKVEIIIADLASKKIQNILPVIYDISIDDSKINIYSTRNFYQYIFRKMPLATAGYHWFFDNVSLESKIYEIVKRLVDIVVSIPLLIIWGFLHPWVSMKIKGEDGGDVFITQERLGRYGNKIYIKKYRTMNFSDDGKWFGNAQNENKVTKVGYFLRKTRIDELPQTLAILKGDLTLIGPRSDMNAFAEKMQEEINFYMIRYAVKPGLSGWAQTMMTKPPQTIDETTERLRYDLYYVKNRSLILDFIIGLKTIKTVLSREGM